LGRPRASKEGKEEEKKRKGERREREGEETVL